METCFKWKSSVGGINIWKRKIQQLQKQTNKIN